jgi:hypothetical protein
MFQNRTKNKNKPELKKKHKKKTNKQTKQKTNKTKTKQQKKYFVTCSSLQILGVESPLANSPKASTK